MILFVVLILFLSTQVAQATTYYVATTGSDSTGTGTESNPWANPQKCVNAGSPLVAGDTCLVKAGTYTDTDGNGITVYASSGATVPQGTAGSPITIKSETPLGAVVMVRQDMISGTQAGFYISKNYYVIEGFEISGAVGGEPSTTNTQTGIALWSSGSVVRRNRIHHIGREFCSSSVNAMSGVYIGTGVADDTVEYNEIYSIGRLRGVTGFQENGCTLTPGSQGTSAHDHGIYASQATRLTVQRNVIWDTQRGYGVHIYSSATKTNPNVKIEHNTFHGEGAIGVGPHTQLLLNGTMDSTLIKNNIFSEPRTETSFPFNVTFTNGVFSGNITTVSTWWKSGNPSGMDMSSPGDASASIGFTAVGSHDHTLASTSTAIDGGVATGVVSSGSAEDQGAFEKFSATSATFDGTYLDVVTDAVFLPLQALSGTTGWSVACTGCGTPVVANASVVGTGGTIRLTITGVTSCSAGGYTVTFNGSTGSVTDSIKIGAVLNQPMHTTTAFAVTHSCSGAPSIPSGAVIRYEANENTGTTLVNTGSLGAVGNGTIRGGGTWGPGQQGTGVVLTAQSEQYIEVPYGTAFNPSSTSLTVASWVDISPSITGLARTYIGTQLGSDQRAYISTFQGNWRIGIQGSNDSTAGNIAVTSGLHHVCLEMNSSTDVATLYVDGVASTAAGAVKSYTSYTFASNFEWGRLAASANGPGGTFDRLTIYEAHGKCTDLYNAENPSAPVTSGNFTLETHRWEGVHYTSAGAVDVRSANGADYQCVSPGAVALHLQIKCENVESCSATTFPLYYSVDGGSYSLAVPDVASADGVYMYGTTSDITVNRFTADGPLSGALTHIDGSTTTVTTSQPQSYAMVQNSTLTVRYLIAFTTDALGKIFRFRVKKAGGVDLDTYTVSPRVDIIPMQGDGVF